MFQSPYAQIESPYTQNLMARKKSYGYEPIQAYHGKTLNFAQLLSSVVQNNQVMILKQ